VTQLEPAHDARIHVAEPLCDFSRLGWAWHGGNSHFPKDWLPNRRVSFDTTKNFGCRGAKVSFHEESSSPRVGNSNLLWLDHGTNCASFKSAVVKP
jgi:hypothetical protein